MRKKLKELLFGKSPIELNHEYFGRIIYMGGDEPSDNDYWEAEASIKEAKAPLTLIINAPVTGPTEGQVTFYKNAISDVDALFDKCWTIFEPDFAPWTGKGFTGDWKDEFELVGIQIPRDADENNEWSVSYEVDAAGHMFTATFVNGVPAYNEIDG